MRLRVEVPATSANLGPGFDCFGLALDLCNEVTLQTGGDQAVTWAGEGAGELPTDGSDLISRTIVTIAEAHGKVLPSFALHGVNRIPLERGLGSSSAAAVAGVLLASALLQLPIHDDPHAVFAEAARIEGHPDNAAPAVFGGFTIAMPNGLVRRLDPHPDLRPVVLVPETVRLSTVQARAALGDAFTREDVVFQASHAALAVVALTQDPALLFPAVRDRVHQDVRLALVPAVREVFDRIGDAGIAVCVSGAGPSLLAFEREDRALPDPGPGWDVLRPGVRAAGARISTEEV